MTSLIALLVTCAMLMTSVQSRSLRQTSILHLLKQLRTAGGGTDDVPDFTHGHGGSAGTAHGPDLTADWAKSVSGNNGAKSVEYDESRTRQSFLQRIQKNAEDETDLQINMCYFCDNRCSADILAANYPNTDAYFNTLSALVETDLNSMDGYTFHVNTHIVLVANMVIQGYWYLDTSAGSDMDMLASVNDNFWTAHNMWQTGLAYGCDAGFHTITESDYIWHNNFCGHLDGVANMFQICNSGSYATMRLELNLAQMSTLCSHELGHLCGLYHDDGVDEALGPYHDYFMTNPVIAPIYQNLVENCQIGNEHCPDGPYHCIMSASVATQTSFSGCSVAYFNMFLGLANQIPSLYEDGCLPAKRSGNLLQ